MRKKRVLALRKAIGWTQEAPKGMAVQQLTPTISRWIAKSTPYRMFKAAKRLHARKWVVNE